MTDTYVWLPQTGTVGIGTAAAWEDASTGSGPPAGPPGPNDIAIINTQGATIEGSGSVGALSLQGSLTLLATSGTTQLSVLGLPGVTQDSFLGTLTVAGQNGASEVLDVVGAANPANPASLTLAGPTTLLAGGTLEAASATLASELTVNGGVLSVGGGLSIGTGAELLIGDGTGYLESVRMSAGSTLVLSGTGELSLFDPQPGGSTITSAGAIAISGPGAITGAGLVEAPISDNAHDLIIPESGIVAAGGTLSLEGPISGSSPLSIGDGAALALAQSDSDAAPLLFGVDATLIVQSTASIASPIGNFTPGDGIDLPSIPYAAESTTVSYANDAITVAATGGETVTLPYLPGQVLNGPYESYINHGTAFFLEPDGTGGSFVSLLPLAPSSDPRQMLLLTTLGTLQRSQAFVETQANVGVWDSGSPPGPAQSGDFNIAVATVGGGSLATPTGYQVAAVVGTEATELFGPSSGNALLWGNDGADTLVGAAGGDTLIGGSGGNFFFVSGGSVAQAGGGADTMVAGTGANTVLSGGGGMLAFLSSGSSQVTADGSDTIVAASGTPTVTAASGVLVFAGSADLSVISTGADTIIGGSGNLQVRSAGTDTIFGGSGASSVFGGPAGTTAHPEFVQAGAGPLLYVGSGYADIFGGGGSDTIFGGAGGGYVAAASNDTVVAGTGATTVTGASGAQLWLQGSANNVLVAGSGNETLSAASSTGDNLMFAGTSSGTLVGGGGSDSFVAGTGNALFATGSGADLFEFANGHAGGNDTISGFRPGVDHVALYGYGSYSLVPGASETLLLPDGTTVSFAGVNGLGPNAFS